MHLIYYILLIEMRFGERIKYILRSDKQLIYLTVGLVILGGLIRLFNYKISTYVLNVAFIPYLLIWGAYYVTHRKGKWSRVHKQRFVLLLVLFVLILLNSFTMFKTEFLMVFILLIDYLLVINKRANQAPVQYKDDVL